MANHKASETPVEAPVDEEYEALLAHYVVARKEAEGRARREVRVDMESGRYGSALADLTRRYPKQK